MGDVMATTTETTTTTNSFSNTSSDDVTTATMTFSNNDDNNERFSISSESLLLPNIYQFLPDYTEHPKPKRKKAAIIINKHETGRDGSGGSSLPPPPSDEEEDDEITFFHDFVAGGVAGSASVIVGHPFDTIKVRMQTSQVGNGGMIQLIREFGGIGSLFRGMTAPLGAAAAINAVVFGSYGFSSRLYDQYVITPNNTIIDDDDEISPTHDPPLKSFTCGSFAGAVQCVIIAPMEHIKCRLQTQQIYKGPVHAMQTIIRQYGTQRLYQGWWSTALREIPAFGLYFASYDYLKDYANNYLATRDGHPLSPNTHTWLASAFAGGCAGSITWAVVYPVDVIKTRVQTSPLDTPFRDLRMIPLARQIAQQHGIRYLFRGLGITLIRAFPVNGTIFPVYEFTLKQVSSMGY